MTFLGRAGHIPHRTAATGPPRPTFRRSPRVRQAGRKTRLPAVLPAVAMATIAPKFENGVNSLSRSARKPTATAELDRITPGPVTE